MLLTPPHTAVAVSCAAGVWELADRSRLDICEVALKSNSYRGGIQSCSSGQYEKADVFFEHSSM